MRIEMTHEMLVAGENGGAAQRQVEHFFATTRLVRYAAVEVDRSRIISGREEGFGVRLASGLESNRATLTELLAELRAAGIGTVDELLDVPQGFQSKLVHTVAHLVDGFFGIDSRFYNLPDDSHRVSESRRLDLTAHPDRYWLVPVTGLLTAGVDQTAALRTFEKG